MADNVFSTLNVIVSLSAAYFVAKAVEGKLPASWKKWVRVLLTLAALIVTYGVIYCVLLAIIVYTTPDRGFVR